MDDLGAHKCASIRKILSDLGVHIHWLPPYTPEANPIEMFWGWMKRRLRDAGAGPRRSKSAGRPPRRWPSSREARRRGTGPERGGGVHLARLNPSGPPTRRGPAAGKEGGVAGETLVSPAS
jgi:hypothetical protein